jgi:hypothetical protein
MFEPEEVHYNEEQLTRSIMLLSESIALLDFPTFDDSFESIWLGVAIQGSTMDPVFVSIYMGEMMRRIYLYNLMSTKERKLMDSSPSPMETARNTQWCHEIVKKMAESAFQDMYAEACQEAYTFIGDDQWFRYKWPNKPHSRADVSLAKPT